MLLPFRLFTTSCGRRRHAFQCAVICTLANIALAVIALRTHRRHVSIKGILYGVEVNGRLRSGRGGGNPSELSRGRGLACEFQA